jgi:hypothetical protein
METSSYINVSLLRELFRFKEGWSWQEISFQVA